jgi:nucleoside-diphosphate-sugar epimerase
MAALPRVQFSVENPGRTDEVNSHGFVKLLEAARGKVRRVILSSSAAVYGSVDAPVKETAAHNPLSPYALQKLVCEQQASLFGKLYDLDVTCLRYFNVYGPGQQAGSAYSTVIAAWCHAIKSGQPLRSDGDGQQTRSHVFVDDVVMANVAAALDPERRLGRCYNIAGTVSISNNEIIDQLRKRHPDLAVVSAPARVGDVRHSSAVITRAWHELGFKPSVELSEGLDITLDWWSKR